MFDSIQLRDLPKRRLHTLREPTSTRPALWVVEEDGHKAVVKDYSVNGILYRNAIGRFLVWREAKAYRRLRGLRGVPAFHRVINGLAVVLEQIPGRTVEGLEKERPLPKAFFDNLKCFLAYGQLAGQLLFAFKNNRTFRCIDGLEY